MTGRRARRGGVMGSAAGALKTAAARVGLTLAEYEARIANGEKWCTGCKAWLPRGSFVADLSRGDGLKARCRDCDTRAAIAVIVKPLRLSPIWRGRRYVDARDGDQKQARRRVNHLVDMGLLPRPNTLACMDCGHVWARGQRRHEYDHHLGYAPEHHEDVEPVCTTCHHVREENRRAA